MNRQASFERDEFEDEDSTHVGKHEVLRPCWLATCTSHPCGVIFVLMAVLSFVVACAGTLIFPSFGLCVQATFSDFYVIGSSITSNYYAFTLLDSSSYSSISQGEGQVSRRLLQDDASTLTSTDYSYRGTTYIYLRCFYYSKRKGNVKGDILESEKMADAHDIEKRAVKGLEGYWDHALIARNSGGDTDYDYAQQLSFLNWLYPRTEDGITRNDGLGDQASYENPKELARELGDTAYDFFDKDFGSPNFTSTWMVSIYQFGYLGPSESWDDLREWILEYDEQLEGEGTKSVGLAYNDSSGKIVESQILGAVFEDLILALYSFAFVFFVTFVYTRSLFLSFFGLCGVLMSFAPSIALFRLIFGDFFNIINFVSIWIILGIGADDIFVFVSSYRRAPVQSADGRMVPPKLRMAYAYREAGSAMLATSFTTACSFYSLALSPINPLPNFGVFIGTLVVFNYLFVMTYFPCVLQLYVWSAQCRVSHGCCCNNEYCLNCLAVPVYVSHSDDESINQKNEDQKKHPSDDHSRNFSQGGSAALNRRLQSLNDALNESEGMVIETRPQKSPFARQSSALQVDGGVMLGVGSPISPGGVFQSRLNSEKGSRMMRQISRKLDGGRTPPARANVVADRDDGGDDDDGSEFSASTDLYFALCKWLSIPLALGLIAMLIVFAVAATSLGAPSQSARIMPDDSNIGRIQTALNALDICTECISTSSSGTSSSTIIITTPRPTSETNPPTPFEPTRATQSPTTGSPTTMTDSPTFSPPTSATANPTYSPPSRSPTPRPTDNPTLPTVAPTLPTAAPIGTPSQNPTKSPTGMPTNTVTTSSPTASPSRNPSASPTGIPTHSPSKDPSQAPTMSPVIAPTVSPSVDPTPGPSLFPTQSPSPNPSVSPTTSNPTTSPTRNPSNNPTTTPSKFPSGSPTPNPTNSPSHDPTANPSLNPTIPPSMSPTRNPFAAGDPTRFPTSMTSFPTDSPSTSPTQFPTANPTTFPTRQTSAPTSNPTSQPTGNPTGFPTNNPTDHPTDSPTTNPTGYPTTEPTSQSAAPTVPPTDNPTNDPTNAPTLATAAPASTGSPSESPTEMPTGNPTSVTSGPTENPTQQPTVHPSVPPSMFPSMSPTQSSQAPTTPAPTSGPFTERSEVMCRDWDRDMDGTNAVVGDELQCFLIRRSSNGDLSYLENDEFEVRWNTTDDLITDWLTVDENDAWNFTIPDTAFEMGGVQMVQARLKSNGLELYNSPILIFWETASPTQSPTESPVYSSQPDQTSTLSCLSSSGSPTEVAKGEQITCDLRLKDGGDGYPIDAQFIALIVEGGNKDGNLTGCIDYVDNSLDQFLSYENSVHYRVCYLDPSDWGTRVSDRTMVVEAPPQIPQSSEEGTSWMQLTLMVFDNSQDSWTVIQNDYNLDSYNFTIEEEFEAYVSQDINEESSINVYLVFGTDGVGELGASCDTEGINAGNLRYDDSFDFYESGSQEKLLQLCEELGYLQLYEPTMYRTDGQFPCFMLEFKHWIEAQSVSKNYSWPMEDRLRMNEALDEYLDGSGSRFSSYVSFGGDNLTEFNAETMTVIGFVQRAVTNMNQDWGASELEKWYKKWRQFMKDFNDDDLDEGRMQGEQVSSAYIQMEVQLAFLEGFTNSLLWTMLLCAFTMTVFTMNCAVIAFVLLYILIVVAFVVGLYGVMKWEFGVIEVISVPTVIGLSIDYALHISHAYSHAHYPDRLRRSKAAIETLGGSVFASSMTTILSMVIMYFAQVTLFSDLGFIVASTGTFGISIALFAPAIFMWIGPEKDQCHFRWFAYFCCGLSIPWLFGKRPVYDEDNEGEGFDKAIKDSKVVGHDQSPIVDSKQRNSIELGVLPDNDNDDNERHMTEEEYRSGTVDPDAVDAAGDGFLAPIPGSAGEPRSKESTNYQPPPAFAGGLASPTMGTLTREVYSDALAAHSAPPSAAVTPALAVSPNPAMEKISESGEPTAMAMNEDGNSDEDIQIETSVTLSLPIRVDPAIPNEQNLLDKAELLSSEQATASTAHSGITSEDSMTDPESIQGKTDYIPMVTEEDRVRRASQLSPWERAASESYAEPDTIVDDDPQPDLDAEPPLPSEATEMVDDGDSGVVPVSDPASAPVAEIQGEGVEQANLFADESPDPFGEEVGSFEIEPMAGAVAAIADAAAMPADGSEGEGIDDAERSADDGTPPPPTESYIDLLSSQ